MKINVIKSAFALVAVAAVGFGSYKVYDTFTTHQIESDVLLVENVEALSQGDAKSSIIKGFRQTPGSCGLKTEKFTITFKMADGKTKVSCELFSTKGKNFSVANPFVEWKMPGIFVKKTSHGKYEIDLGHYSYCKPMYNNLYTCNRCNQYSCQESKTGRYLDHCGEILGKDENAND